MREFKNIVKNFIIKLKYYWLISNNKILLKLLI